MNGEEFKNELTELFDWRRMQDREDTYCYIGQYPVKGISPIRFTIELITRKNTQIYLPLLIPGSTSEFKPIERVFNDFDEFGDGDTFGRATFEEIIASCRRYKQLDDLAKNTGNELGGDDLKDLLDL